MATNNPIDSLDPIQVALGGQGNATLTPQYGVLYANGTAAVGVTNVGTSGQVLTANSAAAPSFQNISAGNSLVLISSQTFSNTYTQPTFSSGISSTYNTYLFIFSNVILGSSGQYFPTFQVSNNGGSSYAGSGYTGNAFIATQSTGTFFQAQAQSTDSIRLEYAAYDDGSFSYGISGWLWCYGVTGGKQPNFVGQISGLTSYSALNNNALNLISGSCTTTNVNAFQFGTHGGGIDYFRGTIALYGLKE